MNSIKHRGLQAMFLFGIAILVTFSCVGQKKIEIDINWEEFLGRHDLVWDKVPETWKEGAFMGNGRQALSMFKEPDQNALRFAVDNDDVFDRRDDSYGWSAYSRARMHVGDFQLHPVGKITGMDLRQDLYNAELRGTLTTDAGQIAFRAFVHTDDPVIVIELEPSEGEKNCRWEWIPFEAITTRHSIPNTAAQAAKYEKQYGNPVKIWENNPDVEIRKQEDINLSVQKLLAGGGYSTAWKEVTTGNKRTLFLSPVMSYPELTSPQTAVDAVISAQKTGVQNLVDSHRDWWNDYYKASFISMTDTRLESFYWIQMYKYACAARADRQVIDTHGPWFQKTGWPYTTWNLNTQISYWALQPSNHLDIAESLFKNLDEEMDQLIQNVYPEEFRVDAAFMGQASQSDMNATRIADMRFDRQWGNLLWVCHNYWLQYRFSMDESMLRDRLYPLLRRATNFYMHYVSIGKDGKYHLPPTYSPEFDTGRDTNYDLSLLKWATQTLVEISSALNLNDINLEKWEDVSKRLVDFPTDEFGYRLSIDRGFDQNHRHHSHLMMIYPLYLVNWDNQEDREIIVKSLDHWLGFDGALTGYSYTIGASIAAAIGDGNRALEYFKGFEEQTFPNGMYAESGQNIETPLSGAQSINDILIQSWGDRIRVFPALPDRWQDVAIHDMRTEGAFLVSVKREKGVNSFVRVKSLKGAPCKIQPGYTGKVSSIGDRNYQIEEVEPGIYTIDLKEGEQVILYQGNSVPDLSITPVMASPININSFGAKK